MPCEVMISYPASLCGTPGYVPVTADQAFGVELTRLDGEILVVFCMLLVSYFQTSISYQNVIIVLFLINGFGIP